MPLLPNHHLLCKVKANVLLQGRKTSKPYLGVLSENNESSKDHTNNQVSPEELTLTPKRIPFCLGKWGPALLLVKGRLPLGTAPWWKGLPGQTQRNHVAFLPCLRLAFPPAIEKTLIFFTVWEVPRSHVLKGTSGDSWWQHVVMVTRVCTRVCGLIPQHEKSEETPSPSQGHTLN